MWDDSKALFYTDVQRIKVSESLENHRLHLSGKYSDVLAGKKKKRKKDGSSGRDDSS